MSIMDLTRLLGNLAATVQAILPENLPTILVSLTPPNQYYDLSRYISSKTTVRYRGPAGALLVDDISNALKWKIPNFNTDLSDYHINFIRFIKDN